MKSRKRRKARASAQAARRAGGPDGASAAASPSVLSSRRRQWFFRLTALIGAPALLLGILELALRLFGFGHPTAFFIKNPVPGQTTLVENPRFSLRYFAPKLMRIPQPFAFSAAKPPHTLRVFVFGGSAAEGDPAPAFGFARILQVMLRDRYPGRSIEVINTAVTAINSHVVRPIAREAALYHGDVWVIYMGNNEVVGPYGSGTVFSPQVPSLALIRANIALKATRTGQLLDDVLARLTRHGAPEEWQGMEMFVKQQVREDDLRMAKVYAYFQSNLSDIIGFGVRSGAQVVVSTVGSNLRDCAPLGSLHRPNLTAAQKTEWEGFYKAGVALEDQGKFGEAIAQYQQATQVDDQFADLQFRLGQCYAATDRMKEAKRHFVLARDLDTLRFRADSRINDIIRQEARLWQARGVRLADAEAEFERASPDGIPGKEWFYEHVHMTFAGNYLLARQVAEQVVQCVPGGENERPFPTLEDCARRLGLTDYDRLRMAEEMLRRTSVPPFTRQLDHAADQARRGQEVSELRQADRTNFQASVKIYEQALARDEDDWRLHDEFAGALLLHGDGTNAVAQWRCVIQLLPHRLQTYDLMGSELLAEGRVDEARNCYQQALRIQPDFVNGLIGLGRVLAAQNRGPEAVREFRRAVRLEPGAARTHNFLGVALLQQGNRSAAEAAFRDALRAEADFVPARLNLGSALLAEGKADKAITNYQELLRSHPEAVEGRVALGRALEKQGKTEEAIQQFLEAVHQQPDDFEAHFDLANALVRANRYDKAAVHFAEAIRLRPDSFESHLNYGSILANQGKPAAACAQFEEALRIKPNFVPAHLNLAAALIERDRPTEAADHLREALRLDPGNATARRLLDNLLARQNGGLAQ